MKKHRVLIWLYCTALAFVIVHIAFEEAKRPEMIALCAYTAVDIGAIKLSKPAPAATSTVRWIAAAAGVAPTFDTYAGDSVPGVALATVRDNKREIIYDAKRFQWGESVARWSDVCTLGHEVGHHLGAHTFSDENRHAKELEADRFAGYACALMGASLAQALAFTDDMPEADGDTHPGQAKRQAAVTEGWTRGETLRRTGKLDAPRDGLTP